MLERFRPEDAIELRTWCSGIAGSSAARRYSITGSRRRTRRGGEHLDPPRPRSAAAAARRAVPRDLRHVGGRPSRADAFHAPTTAAHATGAPWAFRSTDIDRLGHVNNAAYWVPLEDRWATRLGGRPRATLEYRQPIDLGEPIELVEDGDAPSGWSRAARCVQPRGSIQTARASPSSSPDAVKSAVTAPCLRPSLPLCRATTTHSSPASRHAIDPCGESAEHDRSASGDAGRVGAGAVERGPHELRADRVGGRRPRRRIHRPPGARGRRGCAARRRHARGRRRSTAGTASRGPASQRPRRRRARPGRARRLRAPPHGRPPPPHRPRRSGLRPARAASRAAAAGGGSPRRRRRRARARRTPPSSRRSPTRSARGTGGRSRWPYWDPVCGRTPCVCG